MTTQPNESRILLILPEAELTIEDGVTITKKDSWGWLFNSLYLRRNGYQTRLCPETADLIELIAGSPPDLIIWFATSEAHDQVVNFLLCLRQAYDDNTRPSTFILATTRHPSLYFVQLADAAQCFVITPERFLQIIQELLQKKGASEISRHLPMFGTDMRNHPDPEISAFFRKLPP